jgi:hypothetical protein
MRDRKLHAALAIACLALALSIYTAVRGPGGAPAAITSETIDRYATEQTDKLPPVIAARDGKRARIPRPQSGPAAGPDGV